MSLSRWRDDVTARRSLPFEYLDPGDSLYLYMHHRFASIQGPFSLLQTGVSMGYLISRIEIICALPACYSRICNLESTFRVKSGHTKENYVLLGLASPFGSMAFSSLI